MVTKAGCIDDCELESHAILLDVCSNKGQINVRYTLLECTSTAAETVHTCANALNRNSPRLVELRDTVLFLWVQLVVEEGVDKGRLAQSRLSNDHCGEVEPFPNGSSMPLVWQVGETNEAPHLLSARDGTIGGRCSSD